MSEQPDLGRYKPFQDHEAGQELHGRVVEYAFRVERTTEAGYQVAEGHTPPGAQGDEVSQQPRKTAGDVQGGYLWLSREDRRKKLPSWWRGPAGAVFLAPDLPALPNYVAPGSGSTVKAQPASQVRGPRSEPDHGFFPIRRSGSGIGRALLGQQQYLNPLSSIDDRYEAKKFGRGPGQAGGKAGSFPSFMPTGFSWPSGWTGTVSSGTHETEQHDNFHPDFLGLVAPTGKTGNPPDEYKAMGTPVYDVDDEGFPTNPAQLHELVSVLDVANRGQLALKEDLYLDAGHAIGGVGPALGGPLVVVNPANLTPQQPLILRRTDGGRPFVPAAISTRAYYLDSAGYMGTLRMRSGFLKDTTPSGGYFVAVDFRRQNPATGAPQYGWEVPLPFFTDSQGRTIVGQPAGGPGAPGGGAGGGGAGGGAGGGSGGGGSGSGGAPPPNAIPLPGLQPGGINRTNLGGGTGSLVSGARGLKPVYGPGSTGNIAKNASRRPAQP